MVSLNLSTTFIRYAIESCQRTLPLILRLYNMCPEERSEIGYLSAFLTTLKTVLQLAAHEQDPDVVPWEYNDPDQMDQLVNNLLNDFEEEI